MISRISFIALLTLRSCDNNGDVPRLQCFSGSEISSYLKGSHFLPVCTAPTARQITNGLSPGNCCPHFCQYNLYLESDKKTTKKST